MHVRKITFINIFTYYFTSLLLNEDLSFYWKTTTSTEKGTDTTVKKKSMECES